MRFHAWKHIFWVWTSVSKSLGVVIEIVTFHSCWNHCWTWVHRLFLQFYYYWYEFQNNGLSHAWDTPIKTKLRKHCAHFFCLNFSIVSGYSDKNWNYVFYTNWIFCQSHGLLSQLLRIYGSTHIFKFLYDCIYINVYFLLFLSHWTILSFLLQPQNGQCCLSWQVWFSPALNIFFLYIVISIILKPFNGDK